MWKSLLTALATVAVFSPSLAQGDAFEDGMNTMWEVLWHQSGTPTRLVRWEDDLRVRISGVKMAQHRQHTLKALRDVANEAGRKVIDVSDLPDAVQVANVAIQIVADEALPDSQPCETRINFTSETKLDSVRMLLRDSDARRCAYHESMHAMGVRGHPAGETVLSYFTAHVEGLRPLDKAMLRAWYSPQARGGMTPFEILPLMADQLVAISPDRQRAQQARSRFLGRTVEQMQAFAAGTGDVPAIVKQSGKSSLEGIQYGRMEMSYFLGIAYQEGVTVARDGAQGQRWLQRAATMGSRPALERLGGAPVPAAAS